MRALFQGNSFYSHKKHFLMTPTDITWSKAKSNFQLLSSFSKQYSANRKYISHAYLLLYQYWATIRLQCKREEENLKGRDWYVRNAYFVELLASFQHRGEFYFQSRSFKPHFCKKRLEKYLPKKRARFSAREGGIIDLDNLKVASNQRRKPEKISATSNWREGIRENKSPGQS